MKIHKMIALFGTVLMGVASYFACLGESSTAITIGNIFLIISTIIMIIGYAKWQP